MVSQLHQNPGWAWLSGGVKKRGALGRGRSGCRCASADRRGRLPTDRVLGKGGSHAVTGADGARPGGARGNPGDMAGTGSSERSLP